MRRVQPLEWDRPVRALRGTLGALGLASGLAGCDTIRPVAPSDVLITDPTQMYTRLTLDHPAINLSTAPGYDTIQLTATPRDANGDPMPGLLAPTFRSTDTTKVQVTADGLVTAVGTTSGTGPGDGITVIAELTAAGPIRHADTTRIFVKNLPAPPQLASFSIHPVPPDSAVWNAGYGLSLGFEPIAGAFLGDFASVFGVETPRNKTIVPRAVDAAGNAMTGLVVAYTVLDPEIVVLDGGSNKRWDPRKSVLRSGQARVVAQTTAYGITKADTVTYTVIPPIAYDVVSALGTTGVPVFIPSEIRIAPSGFVLWTNVLGDSVDITFDDPANAFVAPSYLCEILAHPFLAFFVGPGVPPCDGGGNMVLPPFPDPPPSNADGRIFTVRARQFTVPGVYTYRSLRTGATGQITVSSGSN